MRAIDAVTASRATYVTENRPRLTRDARRVAEDARKRAAAALDELERARAGLVEARRLELWTELYPSEAAGREPIWGSLAGGQRRALEPMGVQQAVGIESVFAALRSDATWLADAASIEQRQRLAPRAVSQEERERERDRRMEAEGQLHRQSTQDRRRGELDSLRGRL